MYQVKADTSKNQLTLAFSRHVGPDEAKVSAEKIAAALAELRPGFRLVTDLSALETMDVACAPHIERVMDLCNKAGIGSVVRIIPDPQKDIGLSIMALFHYSRRIPIATFDSMAEALKALSAKS